MLKYVVSINELFITTLTVTYPGKKDLIFSLGDIFKLKAEPVITLINEDEFKNITFKDDESIQLPEKHKFASYYENINLHIAPVRKFATKEFYVSKDGVNWVPHNTATNAVKWKIDLEDLFTQVNEYFTLLEPKVQLKLYNILQEYSKDVKLYNNVDYEELLRLYVANFISTINYKQFINWLKTKSEMFKIPATVSDVYIQDPDMNTTREKTYVIEEYIELLGVVIFTRAVLPIVIGYYDYHRVAKNRYLYKTFMLFLNSEVYEDSIIEKLRSYLEANMNTSALKLDELVFDSGLSTDDVLDDIISEVILHKLIGIDFCENNCNAISYIFQTLKNRGDKYNPQAIRGKKIASGQKEDDISYYEDYRRTSSITYGQISEIQQALSDPIRVMSYLGFSGLDIDLFNNELAIAMEYINKEDARNYITNNHITLLGWALSRYINPRSLYYLNSNTIVEYLVMMKIILLREDLPYLGLYMNTYIDNDSSYVSPIVRNSIAKTAGKLYDYYTLTSVDGKSTIVEKTIVEMMKEININSWKVLNTASGYDEYINENGLLVPSQNLSNEITRFIQVFLSK